MDFISGVLKTHQAESCRLHVCVFLIRNHIRNHFLEIFLSFFQNTLRNFVKCYFLAVLQTVYSKPANAIKRGLFEISGRVTFWNISCTC